MHTVSPGIQGQRCAPVRREGRRRPTKSRPAVGGRHGERHLHPAGTCCIVVLPQRCAAQRVRAATVSGCRVCSGPAHTAARATAAPPGVHSIAAACAGALSTIAMLHRQPLTPSPPAPRTRRSAGAGKRGQARERGPVRLAVQAGSHQHKPPAPLVWTHLRCCARGACVLHLPDAEAGVQLLASKTGQCDDLTAVFRN